MNKYSVICIDPPWAFSDHLKQSDVKRGASSNYNTMNISQIKAMKIKELADPNGAILALWVPSSLLQEGLEIMREWGFSFKQTYIWVKTKKDPFAFIVRDIYKNILKNVKDFADGKSVSQTISNKLKGFDFNSILSFGMGHTFRNTHEICLIGINNSKIYKQLQNKSQRTVCFEENVRHSTKPEHLQNSFDLMLPTANKIEIFARRVRPGWTCIGNEVCNGQDINESVEGLII